MRSLKSNRTERLIRVLGKIKSMVNMRSNDKSCCNYMLKSSFHHCNKINEKPVWWTSSSLSQSRIGWGTCNCLCCTSSCFRDFSRRIASRLHVSPDTAFHRYRKLSRPKQHKRMACSRKTSVHVWFDNPSCTNFWCTPAGMLRDWILILRCRQDINHTPKYFDWGSSGKRHLRLLGLKFLTSFSEFICSSFIDLSIIVVPVRISKSFPSPDITSP